jgi:hypothetical protein
MTTFTRVLFLQDTTIKREPIQSSQLPSNKLQKISAGTELVLQSYGLPANNQNHYKLTLKDVGFKGSLNWYAFAEHVEIGEKQLVPVPTADAIVYKQEDKKFVKIIVDRQSVDTFGFLKLVFNVDTIIKRRPIDGRFLNEQSKQAIPAGTELILFTSKPDANNIVKLPIEDGHVKFTLKDAEFKGFTQDWYAFAQHVGISRVG